MNGGFIQNNDYSDTMNTGAVYINPQDGNSSFEMNGYIRNNQAHSGAVFVGDIQPDYTHIASFITIMELFPIIPLAQVPEEFLFWLTEKRS